MIPVGSTRSISTEKVRCILVPHSVYPATSVIFYQGDVNELLSNANITRLRPPSKQPSSEQGALDLQNQGSQQRKDAKFWVMWHLMRMESQDKIIMFKNLRSTKKLLPILNSLLKLETHSGMDGLYTINKRN